MLLSQTKDICSYFVGKEKEFKVAHSESHKHAPAGLLVAIPPLAVASACSASLSVSKATSEVPAMTDVKKPVSWSGQ
jgi:hypothetical protein